MKKLSLKNKSIFPNYFYIHHSFHKNIKNFLSTKNYEEMLCPPASHSPCFETHVHPLQLFSPKDRQKLNLYLHTSPEFVLKSFLPLMNNKNGIYSLDYVFRDDEISPIHRKQFVMLEFYKLTTSPSSFMHDLKDLICYLSKNLSAACEINPVENIQEVTVNDFFLEHLKFSIVDFLNQDDLYQKMQKDFKEICPSVKLPWDDLFNLLWLNFLENNIKNYKALLVTQYPTPLSLLAKKNVSDERTSNRFELFVHGIEIANGYEEEFTYDKNLNAILDHLKNKRECYNYELLPPTFFLNTLKNEQMPSCFGVALGTERLLQALTSSNCAFIDL